MEVTLCKGSGCCPKVMTMKNSVEIGEKDNLVKLKAGEWNLLVDLIKTGKISKI